MICKNCNKEIANTSIYCPECGIKTELNETVQINQATTIQPKSAVINQIATTTKKKPSKEIVILIAVIAFWIVFGIIFVIVCAFDNNSDVIVSNSESGASFNCTMEDVIERYNDNIDEHITNDSNYSDDEYEKIKNQLKLKKSYFEKETENKYFVSNSTYGITIQLDDNGNVYFIDMVWGNNLSDIESDVITILLRGLIISVQPSMDYDTAKQIIIDTDNASRILQKDDVKYMVTYESNCMRFSAIAMFDE